MRRTEMARCGRGHDLGTGSFSDAAAVFIEGDIPHPVQAIFDAPMTATQIQQTGRIGLLGLRLVTA